MNYHSLSLLIPSLKNLIAGELNKTSFTNSVDKNKSNQVIEEKYAQLETALQTHYETLADKAKANKTEHNVSVYQKKILQAATETHLMIAKHRIARVNKNDQASDKIAESIERATHYLQKLKDFGNNAVTEKLQKELAEAQPSDLADDEVASIMGELSHESTASTSQMRSSSSTTAPVSKQPVDNQATPNSSKKRRRLRRRADSSSPPADSPSAAQQKTPAAKRKAPSITVTTVAPDDETCTSTAKKSRQQQPTNSALKKTPATTHKEPSTANTTVAPISGTDKSKLIALSTRVADLTEQLAAKTTRLTNLKKERAALNSSQQALLSQAAAVVGIFRARNSELQAQLAQLRKELDEVKQANANLSADIAKLQQ